jgi:3-hydroxyisobutyrate dehydrogenase-like beta-hydroxyacid dehydrogenase
MNETVAFLGLGKMGQGMAGRLAQAGYRLRVWNRTPGKEDPAWKATVAATPKEAASGAAFVVSMLANDEAVETAVLAERGSLAGMAVDAIHLSASTISPPLAKRLAELHASREGGFLATPVFGRPDAAAAGKLWVLCGGESRLRERAEPLLQAMGQGTFALETPEQALIAKLGGNYLISIVIEGLAETMALGEKGGIPAEKLLGILTGTFFGLPVVQRYGELIAAGRFEPAGFALHLGLKDLGLVLDTGQRLRTPLPLANVIHDHMLTGLARGRGNQDWSALASVVREAAGLPLPTR